MTIYDILLDILKWAFIVLLVLCFFSHRARYVLVMLITGTIVVFGLRSRDDDE